MPANTPHPEHSRSMVNEADIGSGEKSPGQHETDAIIAEIPPLPDDGEPPAEPQAPAGQPAGQPAAKP